MQSQLHFQVVVLACESIIYLFPSRKFVKDEKFHRRIQQNVLLFTSMREGNKYMIDLQISVMS